MRHIACQNDECGNKGAPYFDFEPEPKIVLCPMCKRTMPTIPTPDLSPPVKEEQDG